MHRIASSERDHPNAVLENRRRDSPGEFRDNAASRLALGTIFRRVTAGRAKLEPTLFKNE